MAQQPSEPAHVGPPAGDVAGGNQHFRLVAPPPELFQEHRSVGQVGVHGDDVRGRGGRKAGQERAAVARLLLHDHADAPPFCRGSRAIKRPAVSHYNLRFETQVSNHFLERGKKQFDVLPLVPGRDDNSHVRLFSQIIGSRLSGMVQGGHAVKPPAAWR